MKKSTKGNDDLTGVSNTDKILQHKITTRKEILDKLREQSQKDRRIKSDSIEKKLFALPEFKKAKTVMFFVSCDFEVDTHKMIEHAIEAGKRVCVPVTLSRERRLIASLIKSLKELQEGCLGILEPKGNSLCPIDVREIDLVITPGVAFDRNGNRLGRGKGYYDRFLSVIPNTTPTIGLAYDLQVLPKLPILSHDAPVTRVLYA